MRERKLQLFDLEEPCKFLMSRTTGRSAQLQYGRSFDALNTRYGCYTYAAAEGVCFHSIIYELVFAAVDAKTNWGFPNHVEKNILQGLNCAMTMAEVFALAVYGMSVSWPSMDIGSSGRENPINPLDLTDIL
jgi:hypothetical protein